MEIENTFHVPASRDATWDLLMNVPQVIPCMPGAELIERVDDNTWKATMAVKLGPISLSFLTDITRDEVDETVGRVRLGASARETRGRGAAQASIESTLAEGDGCTSVRILTNVALSGAVAQYGRGMVQDVAGQLVSSFASCLSAQLQGSPEASTAAVEAQQKPISGFKLLLSAIRSWFRRLFGRR